MMESENAAEQRSGSGILKKWGPVALAALAAGGAGIWMGQQGPEPVWPDDKVKAVETAAASETPSEPETPVESDLVRGVINPSSESTIASKMTARIVAMPYGEGQSFPAGALLARFDCSQINAELNAARAATAAYRKTYDTNVELDQYEAVGKNEVAVSKANLGKAEAEANAVAAQLSDCEVRAPFAGKVVEQIARAREIAASGQPLLKIQSGREVELELIVPSKWLTWLEPGATFVFKIDETGNVIRGQVKRFGASVDPVSKTIRVTGVVTERNGLVLAGMSGTATFDDPRASGGAIADPAATAKKPDGQPS
jgi:membrane fusion protein, multidrug efflux system